MAEAKAVRSKYSKDSTSGIIGDSSSHSADIDSKTEPLGLGSSKPSSCFSFTEVKGDLFSCPESSSLAHCVSADLAMGKGVAVLFKRKFGGVAELKAQGMYIIFHCSLRRTLTVYFLLCVCMHACICGTCVCVFDAYMHA